MTKQPIPKWYAYIVKCSDGTYYTGTAIDVSTRIALHNTGKGAKYTAVRRPVQLVYREQYPDRSTACKREAAIKKLTRDQKIQLIKVPGG